MARWPYSMVAFCACAAVESDPGLRADMRVTDAQFVHGNLPAVGTGPAIVALMTPHAQIMPGLRKELLTGSLSADAESVLITRDGDPGYWIVTAGAPAIEQPDLPTFSAELTFADDLTPGPQTLELSAVRASDGAVGPRQIVMLTAVERVRSAFLSVELRWDTEADLDLHVALPDGSELYPGNVNSYAAPPPGASAPDPNAYKSGATIDLDSNGNCIIDGRREERASWPVQPASGTYAIRVATASLCSASIAHWSVQVWYGGSLVQTVDGLSQSSDTRYGTGLGAGLRALEFVVP